MSQQVQAEVYKFSKNWHGKQLLDIADILCCLDEKIVLELIKRIKSGHKTEKYQFAAIFADFGVDLTIE